jgi:hypothetical protein
MSLLRALRMTGWSRARNDKTRLAVLCVSVSTIWPYALVFLVDLIRSVLFLIDPVACNGGHRRSQANSLALSPRRG